MNGLSGGGWGKPASPTTPSCPHNIGEIPEKTLDIAKVIGSNLRAMRGELTQEAFAELTGLDQSALSGWENGKRLRYLQDLADRLARADMNPMELLRTSPHDDEPIVKGITDDVRHLPRDMQEAIAQLTASMRARFDTDDVEAHDLMALLQRIDPDARNGIMRAVRFMVEGASSSTASGSD